MTFSKKIAKSWLNVYEMLLARADKIPLLVEILREHDDIFKKNRELLWNLIDARSETAGMSLPSQEKLEAENRLTRALKLTLISIAETSTLQNNTQLIKLLDEFASLEKKLTWVAEVYNREIRRHRILLFCLGLKKYRPFEFSP